MERRCFVRASVAVRYEEWVGKARSLESVALYTAIRVARGVGCVRRPVRPVGLPDVRYLEVEGLARRRRVERIIVQEPRWDLWRTIGR